MLVADTYQEFSQSRSRDGAQNQQHTDHEEEHVRADLPGLEPGADDPIAARHPAEPLTPARR